MTPRLLIALCALVLVWGLLSVGVTGAGEPATVALSDQDLQRLRGESFQRRLDAVVSAMREQGIDFRAEPFITADGRIAARVVPVDEGAR